MFVVLRVVDVYGLIYAVLHLLSDIFRAQYEAPSRNTKLTVDAMLKPASASKLSYTLRSNNENEIIALLTFLIAMSTV